MPTTFIRIFLDTVERHRKPAQFMRRLPDTAGRGRWESLSAERARNDVESLALGLGALGVRRGERVALLSENRYEWAITDLATLGQGAVTVPVYPTLTAPQIRYILENAEARVCVVSNAAQLEKVLASIDDAPFTWEVREIGLQVAALMTADMIRRRVPAPLAWLVAKVRTQPVPLEPLLLIVSLATVLSPK